MYEDKTLFIKKVIYALRYSNLIIRIYIFINSQFQKKIILPITYLLRKKSYMKLDYTSGFKDKKITNKCNEIFLERLIKFYHKNFKKKKKIKGMWQENLKLKFYDLINVLINKNKRGLCKILNNMFRNSISDGLCVGYEEYTKSKNFFGKIYIKTQFNSYLEELRKNKINIDMLKFENVGNPTGIKYKAKYIGIETLRHANQAFTMTKLTSNIKKPKILEIGGGIGGTCYQYIYSFNKKKAINYYLVDILEVLILQANFFQKKKD